MMSELGNKKNVKVFSAVIALVFVLSIAGLALMQMGNPVEAAPSSNVGVVDMSKAVPPDNKDIQAAQQQMQQLSAAMQKQFEQQSANMTDAQKQELFQKMQGELVQKNQELVKNVQGKVESAIGDVAKTKGLSVVLDKRAVLYGGTDITDQVAKKLSSQSAQ